MHTAPPLIAAALVGLGLVAVSPNSMRGQELWGRGVPAGQVQLTVGGEFEYADRTLGSGDGLEDLAAPWRVSDATLLFPETALQIEGLRAASGDPLWSPTVGPVRGTAQVSRVTFPVELRVGILDRLTFGTRITSRFDRVEGDFGVLPTEGADLGVNPAVTDRGAEVTALLTALNDARTALGDAGWDGFYFAMETAYRAGSFFPVEGSSVAVALSERLVELDAALVAAQLPAIGLPLPTADAALDGAGLTTILTSLQGTYRGFQPIGTSLLSWNPGDAEVWLNWDVRRSGDINTVEGSGVSAWAGARLPFGTLENPNLIFDVGTGDGQLDLLGGVDGWLRRERWGVSGGLDLALPTGATERGVRLLGPGEVVGRSVAFQLLDWTPGTTFQLRLFPSLSLTSGLWADAGYVMDRQGDGTFDLREEVTGLPGVERVTDESGWTRHTLSFGLRLRPPDLAAARIEIWSRWSGAIAGEGPVTPAWSRLEFGGRVWRTLW